MVYRVEVGDRIFQGTDPRALIRLAVQFSRKMRKNGQPSLEDSARYPQGADKKPLRLLYNSCTKRMQTAANTDFMAR